jgi:hypothetical protein
LGKFVVTGIILGVLAVIAALTCPSEEYMRSEMDDNFRQSLERSDSIYMDGIENAIANIGYFFTSAESKSDLEILRVFARYNHLEYYDHSLFSTMRVVNNYHYEGVRCALGIFGIVIPCIDTHDLVLSTGPVQKEYNKQLIEDLGDEEYFGENPDLTFQEIEY